MRAFMKPFIEFEDVSKIFKISQRSKGIPGMVANMLHPRYEYKKAVDHICFSIEEGEMVGFIGPNGAGKSTTIKMLSGILHPDQGKINVAGFIPYKHRKEYVANIGVVFGQKSQLQWDLPPIDSFELLRYIYKIPQERYKKNLDRYVELLDMGGFLKQPVRQLSLGQRMRADIVAALLHSPQIVFFDEPTIGVDVMGKETIRSFIKELNDTDGITMIFTTHDMQDIEKTCKRLIIIDEGSKVYDGSLNGIREQFSTTRQVIVEFA
jgi:ABC-2 type transport system ATP-binding protein